MIGLYQISNFFIIEFWEQTLRFIRQAHDHMDQQIWHRYQKLSSSSYVKNDVQPDRNEWKWRPDVVSLYHNKVTSGKFQNNSSI